MRPASMLSWPSSGPMVRSSRKSRPAGKAPARSRIARLVLSSTAETAGDDTGATRDMALDHGALKRLRSSRTIAKGEPMFSAVYCRTCARPVGLKRNDTAGRVVLVKRGLRIHQLFAGHNRCSTFEACSTHCPLGVQRFSMSGTSLPGPGIGIRVRATAHNRMERQLRRCADDVFQLTLLSQCQAPGSGYDPRPDAGWSAHACQLRRSGGG